MQLCGSLRIFLALPFFGIGMKTDLFQSCGHCWVFQMFWHIECSTFTASSYRIWNSSARIPSPLLALFIVMLPKAHLTSHSRMSDSRWVITPLRLSESWRPFLYKCIFATSSSYLLLLLYPYHFCPLLCPSLHEVFPWYLIFLKRYLVFPILLFSSISLHWSPRKAFLSLLALLWNSAYKWVYISFSLLPLASLLTAICKASSDNHFAFFAFLFLRDGLDPCFLYNVTNLHP